AAKRFPNSRITAVSNSKSQGEYILRKAWAQGLSNLDLKTEDINRLEFTKTFDRIVSVEMLEHVKNYRLVFGRVSSWMKPNGRFFVHVFAHRRYPYHFEVQGPSDWMAKYFFSGGTMPSDDLFQSFDDIFTIEDHWTESGSHYEKTANAWLKRMDSQKDALLPIFRSTYGESHANLWWTRWRLFYLACAELFGIDNGQEYCVSHYRFAPTQRKS
ncbi:MAG: methyltransferase domain-containing protein, partial [Candidatus Eisenbacteria bacterium]|nr:methyltransferase domain-containing protein [Candidatus Eisenbacteria bacterium]